MSQYMKDVAARQRRSYLSGLDRKNQDKNLVLLDDLKVDIYLVIALANKYWPGKKPKNFYFSYPELMIADQVVDLVSLKPMMEFLNLTWEDVEKFVCEIVDFKNQFNPKLAVVLTQNNILTVY